MEEIDQALHSIDLTRADVEVRPAMEGCHATESGAAFAEKNDEALILLVERAGSLAWLREVFEYSPWLTPELALALNAQGSSLHLDSLHTDVLARALKLKEEKESLRISGAILSQAYDEAGAEAFPDYCREEALRSLPLFWFCVHPERLLAERSLLPGGLDNAIAYAEHMADDIFEDVFWELVDHVACFSLETWLKAMTFLAPDAGRRPEFLSVLMSLDPGIPLGDRLRAASVAV